MKTILVGRACDEFSRILAEKCFEVINLPLIETKLLEDLNDFEAKLENFKNYDGIFLTSHNAARILAEKLREKDLHFSGKVYVLGDRGFKILKDLSLDLVFDETANTVREMLALIVPEDLANKKFLFVRGEKSLRVVPEYLAKIAQVDEIVVYRTETITVDADKINSIGEKFKDDEIVAACFFSPSAAESFLKQFGAEVLHQTIIATIGKTTAEFFERRNLQVGFVSTKSNAESFALELTNFLKEDLSAKYMKETKKAKEQ